MFLDVDENEFQTILAALRWYQHSGMGNPFNRPDWLHDIAVNDDPGSYTSLADHEIDTFCERLNTQSAEPYTFSPAAVFLDALLAGIQITVDNHRFAFDPERQELALVMTKYTLEDGELVPLGQTYLYPEYSVGGLVRLTDRLPAVEIDRLRNLLAQHHNSQSPERQNGN